MARDTAVHLARKGFLASPKSVVDATQSLTWMGEELSVDGPCVAHNLSSAVPELWFCSSGGVCVRMRVCSEPLYL